MKKLFSWPFIFLIRVYQVFISPLLPNSCRFTPSCSHYGVEAFEKHGPIIGMYLTVWRILRCNPWSKGGYDPVPDQVFKKKHKKHNHEIVQE